MGSADIKSRPQQVDGVTISIYFAVVLIEPLSVGLDLEVIAYTGHVQDDLYTSPHIPLRKVILLIMALFGNLPLAYQYA